MAKLPLRSGNSPCQTQTVPALIAPAHGTRLSVECVPPRILLVEPFRCRTLGGNPRLRFLDCLRDVVRGTRVKLALPREMLRLSGLLTRIVAKEDSGALILVYEMLIDRLRTLCPADVIHNEKILGVFEPDEVRQHVVHNSELHLGADAARDADMSVPHVHRDVVRVERLLRA